MPLANAILRPPYPWNAKPQELGKAAAPRKARKAGSTGSRLEGIVLRSPGVTLVKVPNGARVFDGGKRMVRINAPVDFVGVYPGGRGLVLDAKEGGLVGGLKTSNDHLKPHQRQMLIRFGQSGAVAGLLCLSTRRDGLFWCGWPKLVTPAPSIRWDEMLYLGRPTFVNWNLIGGQS